MSSTTTTAAAVAAGAGAALVKPRNLKIGLAVLSAGLSLIALRQRANESEGTAKGAVGATGRILFGGPDAGSISKSAPAFSGDLPSTTYTNTFKLRGKILSPRDGGKAQRSLFSDTYPLVVVLANDGDSSVTDRVRVTVREDSYLGDETREVVTDPITLAPGEKRQLTVELPALIGGPTAPTTYATVRFRGFKMDRVTYDRA